MLCNCFQDNTELPTRYSTIGSKFKIPINLGNCYPIPEGHNPELPNPVMSLVESFLSQYYERYDNQVSRQMVSEAYHENATFTLSSNFLLKKLVYYLLRIFHKNNYIE